MFEKYGDKVGVGEYRGRPQYFNIGHNKLIDNRRIYGNSWIRITGGVVVNVTGPDTMTIDIPEQVYRNPGWRRGLRVVREIRQGPQNAVLHLDTTNYRDGDAFEGEMFMANGELRPYTPITREQFADALDQGFKLIEYGWDDRGHVEETYER